MNVIIVIPFPQIEGLSMEPEDEGSEGEGEDGEQGDHITQRLLNIMAGFLEGEVRTTYWELALG
jgi:hypothetical protein